MSDLEYMRAALELAQEAALGGEVPVGAVIVFNGEIIARAHNMRESKNDPVLHAETAAISLAAKKLGTWKLCGCTLYVTLEPCPMCAGAVINSRLSRLVYGADDPRGGAAGSVCNLFEMPFNHRPLITSGVLADECADLMKKFFSQIR